MKKFLFNFSPLAVFLLIGSLYYFQWKLLIVPLVFFTLLSIQSIFEIVYFMRLSMKALLVAQLKQEYYAMTFEEMLVACENIATIPVFFSEEALYIATTFTYQLGWIKQSEGTPPRIELT